MGYLLAEITVSSPRKPELHPFRLQVLADTDAVTLCITEGVASQLDLKTESMREVTFPR
jgi:hypothetical protein